VPKDPLDHRLPPWADVLCIASQKRLPAPGQRLFVDEYILSGVNVVDRKVNMQAIPRRLGEEFGQEQRLHSVFLGDVCNRFPREEHSVGHLHCVVQVR